MIPDPLGATIAVLFSTINGLIAYGYYLALRRDLRRMYPWRYDPDWYQNRQQR